MVTTIIPIDIPLNPYNFKTPDHQDFSRFPNPVAAHHVLFRQKLLKTPRTLGEQILADILEVAFADLWVIEQCPVHNRFPDFFIPAFNLAIEVDGGYHRKGTPRHRLDHYKDWALTKRGFNVLHIENQILIDNYWGALLEIREFIGCLLDPISSSGPFCPWGWTYYIQHKPSEEDRFSLTNPNDLTSIRWEISKRYLNPENCPSSWCVADREESFRIEADTLDLAKLEYECNPGCYGIFLYPRCDKKSMSISCEQRNEENKSISTTICGELGRLLNINPNTIKPSDSLVSDLGLDPRRKNELREALEEAFDMGIPFTRINRANSVSDIVRYFWHRKNN